MSATRSLEMAAFFWAGIRDFEQFDTGHTFDCAVSGEFKATIGIAAPTGC